jgi:hypothetical protein
MTEIYAIKPFDVLFKAGNAYYFIDPLNGNKYVENKKL